MRLGWRRRADAPDPEAYPPGPVRDLATAAVPHPQTPVSEVDFLAVDLETTGLKPVEDHVLAAAWVPVRGGAVVLAGAHETAVRPPRGTVVGESATVHGLTDDLLAAAPELDDVLPGLLGALRGRVLLAHHAPLELGFLEAASRRLYGVGLPLVAVDTLALQHRLVAGAAQGEVAPGVLRLDAARRHFGLPRYPAHHALTDAIATAELFLAQVAELAHRSGGEPTLADLVPVRRR